MTPAVPTIKQAHASPPATRGWLVAALGFALLFAGRTMAPTFGPGDVVQDDMRQWSVWLARLRDGELFRNDLIADYYQTIAPPGYSALYWALSRLVDPLAVAKLLPPLLGLSAALFTFLLVRRLHPCPAGAFLATALLSWYVWQYDDLASGTPRAFLLPLLAAQLWALTSERLALATGLVVLAALFYPPAAVLGLALLGVRLVRIDGWRPRLTPRRSAWAAFLAAAFLAAAAVLPGQLAAARFGPLVSADEARAMPEFGPNGRLPFFEDGNAFFGSREAGFDLRVSDALFPQVPIMLEYLILAMLLPLLLLLRRRLPSVGRLGGETAILLQLLVASLGLFLLAHLLLFHLYHPSRYVKWSMPLALAVAAGLALGILIETLAARVRPARRGLLAAGLALGLVFALAVYPAEYHGNFRRDSQPALTAYLRAQPKDFLVAGVMGTDSVPALAERPILASREHALPYHLGYYREMRRRIEDMIAVYYADSPGEVAHFAARYGVDAFLVNRAAFEPATFTDASLTGSSSGQRQATWEPFTSAMLHRLEGRQRFALLEFAERCAVFDDGQMALVPTRCLHDAAEQAASASS